jgi:hypothetical protein
MLQPYQHLASQATRAMQNMNLSGLPYGESVCPCLTKDQLESTAWKVLRNDSLSDLFSPGVDFETYGYGCQAHDAFTLLECSNCGDECPDWCSRQWCWVNPDSCNLLNTLYKHYPVHGHYYSYSTCRTVDSFTNEERIDSLKGKTIRIGFTSNSGMFAIMNTDDRGLASRSHANVTRSCLLCLTFC